MRGDFNLVCFPYECRRGGRISSSMRSFFEVIDDLAERYSVEGGVSFYLEGRKQHR